MQPLLILPYFYSIDLLPPSPNIQILVELLSCSTSALLPFPCEPDVDSKPHKLPTDLFRIEAFYTVYIVHISSDYFTIHALYAVMQFVK